MKHPAVVLAVLGACASACSSGTDFIDAGAPPSLNSDSGVNPKDDASACAQTRVQGAPVPLDVIFLLDRSQDMGGTGWLSASHAILDFIDQGFAAPTQVGLNLYPFTVNEDVFGDQIGVNVDLCAYRLYQSLVVPVAPFASQRRPFEEAIARAVVSGAGPGYWGLGGEAPLYAALQGTYVAATKNADAHPDHQTIVVLLGQGVATSCDAYDGLSTNEDVMAGFAASALRYNGVRTFALALPGANAPFLSKLTAAGNGSVLTAASRTEADYLTQLNLLKRKAIGCTFDLPPPPQGQALDPTSVSVNVTATTGDQTPIPRVADPTRCVGGLGFYLDGAAQSKVVLCPASCKALDAAYGSRVDLFVGCGRGTK